jgi:hypothetical protein
MMKHHTYTEYGITIISVNWVIHEMVEPQVIQFCINNDLPIRHNSRDVKKIISHFIANSILDVCRDHVNTKNILNYTPLSLKLLDTSMHDVVHKSILKIFKKFRFCNAVYTGPLNILNLEQIYELKALTDSCHIKQKTLERLKEYLSSNDFIKLHKDIRTDIVLQQILAK